MLSIYIYFVFEHNADMVIKLPEFSLQGQRLCFET